MKTAVEWLSNQAYELFEQYSEGNFDRIQLNKLMVKATMKAKEMEKEQLMDAFNGEPHCDGDGDRYYNETFKSE